MRPCASICTCLSDSAWINQGATPTTEALWPGARRYWLDRPEPSVTHTVWLTVHRCDAETVEAAEAELFEDAPVLLSNRGTAPLELAE